MTHRLIRLAAGFCAAALLAAAPARAQDPAAHIKRVIEPKINAKIDSVTKTSYLGLYEVRIGKDVIYTDESATLIFVGDIRDAKTMTNYTEERRAELTGIDFKDLPLADAVKTVRGSGKRQVAVFADPNCGYCKRFEAQMAAMEDVTIYTFLYPILSPDSGEKSKSIWCSKDPSASYYDLMLKGTPPTGAKDCKTPLERNLALGRKLGIDGTPTTFVGNGQRVVGARFDAVQRALDKVALKQ